MIFNHHARRTLALIVSSSTIALSWETVQAQDLKKSFEIPAEPARVSIPQFARQSGLQVLANWLRPRWRHDQRGVRCPGAGRGPEPAADRQRADGSRQRQRDLPDRQCPDRAHQRRHGSGARRHRQDRRHLHRHRRHRLSQGLCRRGAHETRRRRHHRFDFVRRPRPLSRPECRRSAAARPGRPDQSRSRLARRHHQSARPARHLCAHDHQRTGLRRAHPRRLGRRRWAPSMPTSFRRFR